MSASPSITPVVKKSGVFPCPGGVWLTLFLLASAAAALWLPGGFKGEGRLALSAFAFAVVMWSTTSLNPGYVALAAALALVTGGVVSQTRFFHLMGAPAVWLVIGAFVIGAAVRESGIAGRITRTVETRTRTVGGLFWMMTAVLIPLAFFIPSTSGRAAVAMPVFHGIRGKSADPRVSVALSLLIPTIILVGTIVSLTGAGSHLVANDLLAEASGRRLSFAGWMAAGLPFGIAACALSCFVVMRLFLPEGLKRERLELETSAPVPWSGSEKVTLAVVGLMLALWMTTGLHGLHIATVAMCGAVVLCLPRIGVISWDEALAAVSWKLVLFVGAALVLGSALMESGAAREIIAWKFSLGDLAPDSSRIWILFILSIVTLTSHLYITSHIARAAALMPSLLVLGNGLDLDPLAVMFIGTVGMNFCLTFPVSSKALLLFHDPAGNGYRPRDLLLLSAVMGPAHLALIGIFYHGYWQWIGMKL